MESEVGELRPMVSILIGWSAFSVLSILKRPSEVQKKKTWGLVGSNSTSRL